MKAFRRALSNECIGTCLQGTVLADYELLVECFGEPEFDMSEKTPAEWCLAFEDGTIATIYCWKTFGIPDGLWDWNVGGFGPQALERVTEIFDAQLQPEKPGDPYYYIADKGEYQILGREDNELVYFDFRRIGETDLEIIRFAERRAAEEFIANALSNPKICHIVKVLDDGDFLHVLSSSQ